MTTEHVAWCIGMVWGINAAASGAAACDVGNRLDAGRVSTAAKLAKNHTPHNLPLR